MHHLSDILIANAKGELCCADWFLRDCAVQKERILGFRMVLGRLRFVTGTRLSSGDYLILVSDVARSLSEYSLRWGIEPIFGAFKSRGFDLEATHVSVFRLGLDFLQPIVAKLCRTVNDCEGAIALNFLSST